MKFINQELDMLLLIIFSIFLSIGMTQFSGYLKSLRVVVKDEWIKLIIAFDIYYEALTVVWIGRWRFIGRCAKHWTGFWLDFIEFSVVLLQYLDFLMRVTNTLTWNEFPEGFYWFYSASGGCLMKWVLRWSIFSL